MTIVFNNDIYQSDQQLLYILLPCWLYNDLPRHNNMSSCIECTYSHLLCSQKNSGKPIESLEKNMKVYQNQPRKYETCKNKIITIVDVIFLLCLTKIKIQGMKNTIESPAID